MKLHRELRQAIERIADAAGATVAYDMTGNLSHIRVTFTYQGRSRFITVSGTPRVDITDVTCADARRALRALGYVKPKAASAPKEKPWRNQPPRPTECRATRSGPRYRYKYLHEVNAMTATLRQLRARMS